MSKAFARIIAVSAALSPAPALALGCDGGVGARSDHVAVCVRSQGTRRVATVAAARTAELSAEFGIEVSRCAPDGGACAPVAVHTEPGDVLPPVVSVPFDAAGGRHRLDYGVCDKAQEICLPGAVEFDLPAGR